MRSAGKGCVITLVILLGAFIFLLAVAAVVNRTQLSECVALVRIEGPIYESRETLEAIKRARESNRAKAVLVRVDSPGGAVGASEEIFRELQRTKASKPVIVSMGNVAASGGYYVALAGQEIVANAGTITGSIGVIATDFELEQLLATLKIRPVVIKSGEHKDTGSPLRPMTDEERRLLQKIVYDLHRQFVREVVRQRQKSVEKALCSNPSALERVLATTETKNRERSLELQAFDTYELASDINAPVEIVERIKNLADGRVFTGEQALALGLIDSLGNLEDARLRAVKLANLPVTAPLVDFTPQRGIGQLIDKLVGKADVSCAKVLQPGIDIQAH